MLIPESLWGVLWVVRYGHADVGDQFDREPAVHRHARKLDLVIDLHKCPPKSAAEMIINACWMAVVI